MHVKIKQLHHDAKTPTYATEGSACFDLYAATASHSDWGVDAFRNDTFGTGLAFEIPKDHVMIVFSRSGHGFNEGATLINGVGIIDSDYRGEVAVKMNKAIKASVGGRIAQAMVIPVEQVEFIVTATLNETERGQNGFGSTGIN